MASSFAKRASRMTPRSSKKILPLPTIAVLNPAVQSSDPSLSFRLFTGDLKGVRCFGFSVRLGKFILFEFNSKQRRQTDEIFKQEVTQERISLGYNPGPELPESWMGSFLCLLVVPALPRNEVKLKDLFVLFREMGVGGGLEPELHAGEPPSSINAHFEIFE